MSTDDRWQEIDAIFDAALSLDRPARAAFIAERCTDPEVRRQVAQLLEHVDTHSGFLATGGAGGDPALDRPGPHGAPDLASAPTGPGRHIGGYRLIEQIGSGGMGEVWKAEQSEPVQRLVALKLIKPGMDSREVVARFESERQALAIMNHPNIARVFDGGVSASGSPYFVMELVRGAPITEYCDLNRLPTRKRLDLFVQVCAGVQHAHQKGIIHRDIKPTNVLVTTEDGPPVPKIIDFGIARAIDHRLSGKTLHTKLGQIIGTPGYMSPEQVEMGVTDVDTRTDVYSLGILLYELLTSMRPFDPDDLARLSFEELRRTIREQEPTRPSQRMEAARDEATGILRSHGRDPMMLAADLRGDLDWIVMKAIDKDRTNRYGSPQELAEDVRRHLKDEPVTASPPSVLYRLEKFARRHRMAFALSAAISFGIVAASVTLTYALVQSRRQQARIEAALAEAEHSRDESEAVTEFLSDMLTAAVPGRSGRDVTVHEVLDRSAPTIDQHFGPGSLVGARLRGTMGFVYEGLGFYDNARPLLERAYEIIRDQVGESDPRVTPYLERLAILYGHTGETKKAQHLYEQALAILEAQDPRDEVALAGVLTNLSSLFTEAGAHAEAARVLERALELQEKHFGPDHPHVAGLLNNIAVLLKEAGEHDRARTYYERALATFGSSLGSDHPWNLTIRSNLSGVLVAQGDLPGALAMDQEVLAARERTLGPDHPDVALSLSNLAELQMLMGDHSEALESANRALAIRQAKLGTRHPKVATTLRVRAAIHEATGRLEDARADLESALLVDEASTGQDRSSLHEDVVALARVLRALGDGAAATHVESRYPWHFRPSTNDPVPGAPPAP